MSKRTFRARWNGTCSGCGEAIRGRTETYEGDEITWTRTGEKRYYHATCKGNATPEAPKVETSTLPDVPETTPTPTTPTPTTADTSEAGAVLASLVRPYLESKVDRTEVERIVREATDHLTVPRRVVIETPGKPDVDMGTTHRDFERVLGLVQTGRAAGFSVYLTGEPGSGKTTLGEHVAKALGLPFYLLSLAPMSPPSVLTGYGTADGRYVASDAFRAYTEGGVLVVDEIDNANDGLLTAFNGALAGQFGSWPVHGTTPRHPDFVLMATGNTPGLGATPAFPSRRKLDAAFRDRFVFHTVDYDESLEATLALGVNPDAGRWIEHARKLRAWCRENAPTVFVTPRAVVFGAALMSQGLTATEAADAAVWRGAPAETANRAYSACGTL
jgi:hypothetical protein